MEMIKATNITKTYGNHTVFDNLSIDIEWNKITAILGESGVGKTTLLNIFAGLTDYCGEVKKLSDRFSYVFQNDRLIPNLTVRENLKLVIKDDFTKYVEFAGLNDYLDEYPKALSKGMARRVAILRAVLVSADTVLMDEPFTNLDIALKYKLMDFYRELIKTKKRTTVIVTHDVNEASYFADRVVIIKGGKIVYDNSEDVKNKTDEFIKVLCE